MPPSPTPLRIVTRRSPLALRQAEIVRAELMRRHAGLGVELIPVWTEADRRLDTPLAGLGGKGLFVKELERCLVEGRADLAVHSLKDVTVEMPAGLCVPAVLAREDPHDALVSQRYASLDALPDGARVGTSSLRRRAQLCALRPDLEVLEVRGNVGTRLARLERGDFDAILLAVAGLKRLDLSARIAAPLDTEIMLPAIGQGALAVQCRAGDEHVLDLVEPLDDPDTHACTDAERSFNRRLGGDCHVPIAGHAELCGTELYLRGLVARPDGREVIRGSVHGPSTEAQALGIALAEALIGRGAATLLAALGVVVCDAG
ncbi:MAG: hydroxymethylbilane synthase [Gammaproteobacteria bacterium]